MHKQFSKMEWQKKKVLLKKPNYSEAGKYSHIAFQMIIIIGGGTYGGIKLDEHFETKPIFTAIISLLSVAIAIYLALKDFIKPQK
jgi:ATP synthase protein I